MTMCIYAVCVREYKYYIYCIFKIFFLFSYVYNLCMYIIIMYDRSISTVSVSIFIVSA